jgi:hypothetical protein
MAEKMKPSSPEAAPDPARSYERSHPNNEAGMGRLDNNKGTPAQSPDQIEQAVSHKQTPRQLNAHEVVSQRAEAKPAANQPDHSMKDEEPLGSDQAPTDIHDPRQKRHPRTEGKGGTP